MLIGTCGFGSTGSSVITDYLKEYDSLCVMDGVEFNVAFCPDGLADLERHLMHPHSRVSDSACALERFRYMMLHKRAGYLCKKMHITPKELKAITDEYIDSLTQVSWPGFQNFNNSFWKQQFGGRVLYYKMIPFLQRHFNISFRGYPMTQLRLAVCPEDFYTASKKFVNNILERMGADLSKTIVLDQPFSGNDPAACFPFYEDPVAIVVDRDPRDNYVFAKTKLKGHTNGFMPVDDVKDFVTYYRCLRDNQPYKRENPRVLRMQFESLVYDYDNATAALRKFLHLPENPAPRSIFDPALSINNTQVFLRFPQFAEEVRYIEEHLPEYLFDFSRYEKPDLSGEMFFGKSPKNKG